MDRLPHDTQGGAEGDGEGTGGGGGGQAQRE